MSIKLNYNAIDTFTGADIGDYGADPDFIYEMYSSRPNGWQDAFVDYRESNDDLELAIRVIQTGLISISQDGNRYPLDTIEDVKAIFDAIEQGNPGQGETFIHNLAYRSSLRRFSQEAERLGNYETSLEVSENGVQQKEKT